MAFAVEDRKSKDKESSKGAGGKSRTGKQKGGITVEASIIVPVVILAIAAVIYMGLLLYQRSVLQSAAETAAGNGAAAWSSGIASIRTGWIGENGFDRIRLYRRIYDSQRGARLKQIEDYSVSLASRGELIKPENTVAEAEIKDYSVCRKLIVTMRKSYHLPFGKYLRLFGGNEDITICAKASAMLDEPVELIRNTDFILDLEKELEENNPDLKNLGEKTRNAMNDLKERLGSFLD